MKLENKLQLNYKSLLLIVLSYLFIAGLYAKTETITVNASGTGNTEALAIESALVQAVSKVNGAEIAAITKSTISEVSSTSKGIDLNEEYQNKISTKTKGLIKNWNVNSVNKQKDGIFIAKLTVSVSKFKKSKQVNRLRIAIVPFRIADTIKETKNVKKFESTFSAQLENYLTQTRRFAVLDRKNMEEQSRELNFIAKRDKTSVATEELAKIGNRLGVDYLIVGMINKASTNVTKKESKVSDKVKTIVNSYASINIRIIDVATTQIKFADTFEGRAGSSIETVASNMVKREVGNIIVESIYPIRIISASKIQAVLGQGGKTMNIGDIYKIYQLGEKMIDPYTKESLGREEIEVGAVKILTVRPKFSDARILESIIDLKTAVKDEGDKFVARLYKKSSAGATANKKKPVKKAKSVEKLKKESEDDW
tara:strand:- start:84 stop:1358 length:1275 start_codon:yes stop_codon:yes gene_type:complete